MGHFLGIPVLGVVLLFTSINLGPQGNLLTLRAKVVESDRSALREGDDCQTRIEPVRRVGGYNCRVTVTCGSTTLYGGDTLGGFLRCDAVAGHYQSGFDDDPYDGDPAIDLELTRRRIEIRSAFPQPHRTTLRIID